MSDMDAREGSQLVFDYQDDQKLLEAAAGAHVYLGSGELADVRVEGAFTSKNHACVLRREHHFVLVDTSTNGTYVQTEDEQVTFVHRGELRLWGNGFLSLGTPLNDSNAIRFQHI